MAATRGIAAFAKAQPLAFALTVAIVSATGGFVAAVTISQTTFSGIFGDVTDIGTSFSITSTAIRAIKATAAAAGNVQGSAIEMVTSSNNIARTAETKANWRYEAVVQEASVAAVTSGTFKVELFLDDVSKGALYMTQGTSDAGNVEGVKFRWDIGSDMPTGATSFQILITQVA